MPYERYKNYPRVCARSRSYHRGKAALPYLPWEDFVLKILVVPSALPCKTTTSLAVLRKLAANFCHPIAACRFPHEHS